MFSFGCRSVALRADNDFAVKLSLFFLKPTSVTVHSAFMRFNSLFCFDQYYCRYIPTNHTKHYRMTQNTRHARDRSILMSNENATPKYTSISK